MFFDKNPILSYIKQIFLFLFGQLVLVNRRRAVIAIIFTKCGSKLDGVYFQQYSYNQVVTLSRKIYCVSVFLSFGF